MDKRIVCKLDKYDDFSLYLGIKGINVIHSGLNDLNGFIYIKPFDRYCNGQYPMNIIVKHLGFNKEFDYKDIRKHLEDSEKEKLLIYRDSKGNLADTLYLGKSSKGNSYNRIIFSPDKNAKDFYDIEELKNVFMTKIDDIATVFKMTENSTFSKISYSKPNHF